MPFSGSSTRVAIGLATVLLAGQPAVAAENPLCVENRHSQALLIGNRDYRGKAIEVPFALNDVEAMKKFLVDKLCYRDGNIHILRNATFNEMRFWLGGSDRPEGRLWHRVRENRSNVFVYYSGHGVPDPRTRKAYLLPVDTHPDDAAYGYALDRLDANMQALNGHIGQSRTVTVVIDACFSGRSAGGDLQSHSGAIMPELPSGRDVIRFTASGSGQLALWNRKKKLGLFTSVFLEAVDGAADTADTGNRDGTVTGRELTAYLADEVAYRASSLFAKDQTPTVPDGTRLGWRIVVGKPKAPASSLAEDFKLAQSINTRDAWRIFLDLHGKAETNRFVRFARAALAKLERDSPISSLSGTDPGTGRDDTGESTDTARSPALHSVLREWTADFDERTYNGNVSWQLATETSPSIPGRKLSVLKIHSITVERGIEVRLSIRKNHDPSLPASHLVEVVFDLPDKDTDKGVSALHPVSMKETENSKGEQLGVAIARIKGNDFLMALSKSEWERNRILLSQRNWIEIPFDFKDGGVLRLAIEKGSSGQQAVERAMAAWASE